MSCADAQEQPILQWPGGSRCLGRRGAVSCKQCLLVAIVIHVCVDLIALVAVRCYFPAVLQVVVDPPLELSFLNQRPKELGPGAPLNQRPNELGPGAPGLSSRRLGATRWADFDKQFESYMSVGSKRFSEGWYQDAADNFEKAQQVAVRQSDDDHFVASTQQLAAVRLLQGQLKDAQYQLDEALSKTDVTSQRSKLLHLLGNVKCEMGLLSRALELYEEARVENPKSPRLLADIADTYVRRGELNRASETLGLAIPEQALKYPAGKDHEPCHVHTVELDNAYVASLWGLIHYLQGDAASCLAICQQAFRVQAKGLRAGHPELIRTRMRMARAQRDLGSMDGALHATEAVEATLRSTHVEGLEFSRVLARKGDLLRELGRVSEAEAALKEVLDMQARCYGREPNPEIASALNIYGGILHDEGKARQAAAQYQRALVMNLETVGHWHPETAAIHNSLGTLYQDSGMIVKAREHFQICLEVQLKTVGAASPDVASTYNNIATIAFQQGNHAEAVELLRQALRVLDEAGVPQDSPDRAVYVQNLDDLHAGPTVSPTELRRSSSTRPISAKMQYS